MTARPAWYAAHYCEENAWRLAADPALAADDVHVVFISNPARACPVFCQRAAPSPAEPVCWDYHVVVVGRRGGSWQVFDLDSTLAFPCAAAEYLARAFPHVATADPVWHPWFRVVDVATLRAHFASDRSHMRGPDGAFSSPPPALPCIRTPTDSMNLWKWVDMTPGWHGRVLDFAAFSAWVAASEPLRRKSRNSPSGPGTPRG
ncbi:MAG: hypothetical protein HY904_16880 [Deltaproteobacteria bacterium]|nr:hypothetical protein [Deltaproteobacteria bacterium]